jgi:cytochrome c biogenesis protein CcmG, thiol:disulfide interchange protein DsbE
VLVAVAVLVPLALLVMILAGRGEDDDAPSAMPDGATVAGRAELGSVAPDFALESLAGGQVRLSDYRGTPVVVSFIASWCNPCEKELPLLEKTRNADREAFAVLAVTYRDLRGDTEDFVDRLGVTFPALFDGEGDVARAYGVRAIPQTFFIDADGVIRDRVFGIDDQQSLDEPLGGLLGG